MDFLTPPSRPLFLLTIVIFFASLISHFVAPGSFLDSYWVPVIAYVLLTLGVLIRGI